jgi:hypothetical protein
MIGESDGQAPQVRDRYRGIAWQALGESDWHRREEGKTGRGENGSRGKRVRRKTEENGSA